MYLQDMECRTPMSSSGFHISQQNDLIMQITLCTLSPPLERTAIIQQNTYDDDLSGRHYYIYFSIARRF